MSEQKIIIPFEYKKYLSKSGKEVIRLVMAKKGDNPKYFRGKVPKGSVIEKDILNTIEDAKASEPIIKEGKLLDMPKEEMKGGFIQYLLPFAMPLLSKLFGSGRMKKINNGLPVSIDDPEKILNELTYEKFAEELKKLGLNANKTDIKRTISFLRAKVKKASKKGGLFQLPFDKSGGLASMPLKM